MIPRNELRDMPVFFLAVVICLGSWVWSYHSGFSVWQAEMRAMPQAAQAVAVSPSNQQAVSPLRASILIAGDAQ